MNRLSLKKSIDIFLAEDICFGDVTSEAIFSDWQKGTAEFVAKDFFMVAGMASIAGAVFQTVNPTINIIDAADDGAAASPGDILLKVEGPIVDLLKAERVALNLVQRLCGVATMTFRFVEKVRPLPVRIVDTRKTTPGLRVLEKYAVRVGGGHNHRFSLADGILIKDNHIAACGTITTAVDQVRQFGPQTLKIEVEAETLEQVRECLECGVDIIMLDNMNIKRIRKAVELVDGRAEIEASGRMSLENVREVAEAGVNIISVGALTHSVRACDISMRYKASAKKQKKAAAKGKKKKQTKK